MDCFLYIQLQILVALSPRFMRVLSEKKAFVMRNFECTVYCRSPQKAHPWLISRVLSLRSCKSVHGFFSGRVHEKKACYKKVTDRLYFTYLRKIPPPN